MINKQGIWFLTLTSLALVLSVYYITMPNELLLTNNSNYESTKKENKVDKVNNVDIKESDIITSMRVELDNERTTIRNELQGKLNDSKLTVDEKNEVYEDLRYLSNIASIEETLEQKLKQEFKLSGFVKIDNDIVDVVVKSSNHDKSLAVNIMKSLQEEFTEKKYISVSFKE
ncbi:MAG: SpoIIIAH-like family protein [Erysipelotrichaceae bacterium]|nr:SpoIIIAH-like family protein [Erysipelotrichaceae bacterium]